jgi:phosphomannomutase
MTTLHPSTQNRFTEESMSGIFKAYDIRGSYPDELNEDTAVRIGRAFARLLHQPKIVLGRDMRLSSPSLSSAFVEGALSEGATVTDIGMVTTPRLYYAIIEGKYDGGAMVTASHLPARMNGLKLCRKDAIPLSGNSGLPALEKMVNSNSHQSKNQPIKGSYQKSEFLNDYIDKLIGFVHRPGKLKVAVDVGNGMAGEEISLLFQKIPDWELIPLYLTPDGRFPHHVPNPLLPDTTGDLQRMVVEKGADLGVAFDGDADRCGFIDEKGKRVPEDLVTALIAEFLLAKKKDLIILYDLRSSRIVPETITRLKGRAIRCRVGHAFIKAQMREEKAEFAGELSGHYYYKDMGYTDNAMLTMIHLLNFLSLKGGRFSDLILPLRKYYSTGEVNLQVKDKEAIFIALEGAYRDARIDHLDGLTVEYDSWWFNLRASNTEPLLRLNLEADSPKTKEEKKQEVLQIIRKTDSSMTVKE